MTQMFLKCDVAHYCFLLSLIYSQIELLCFGRSHQWELAVRYRRWGVGHGILERTGDLAVRYRRRWGGHGILECTGDLATGDLAVRFRKWGGHGILEHMGSGCQVQKWGGHGV